MTKQLTTLFPPRPLLYERLGPDVFESIPSTAGIYRFFDSEDKLLYVGKAKNLRHRLFSYKRAKAGKVSKKVTRLVSRTSRIDFEETESEKDALLLENRLIREKRPPFNHANKQTEAYYFVYLKPGESGLDFRLSMSVHMEADTCFWHGCFKGHNPVRRAMGCLLQLLWMAENRGLSPHYLPVQLTRRLTPMRYRLVWEPDANHDLLPDLLQRFIEGEACELLDWLLVQIECGRHLNPFEAHFLEDRLACLKIFFDRKLVRHRKLRNELPSERKLIAQNELDDLIVKKGRSDNGETDEPINR